MFKTIPLNGNTKRLAQKIQNVAALHQNYTEPLAAKLAPHSLVYTTKSSPHSSESVHFIEDVPIYTPISSLRFLHPKNNLFSSKLNLLSNINNRSLSINSNKSYYARFKSLKNSTPKTISTTLYS